MTNQEFESLVARLEPLARANPALYRSKVILLALLGNTYVMVLIALLCILFLATLASIVTLKFLALKVLLILGPLLWALLKALKLDVPPPEGTEIFPREAPELFAMINELRQQLGAPRFHHVLITDDFNAAVAQIPRLGILGWPRNYLIIGLPLLKAIKPEQFRAVLAHEFGHLAKGHGRISHWVYRQRLRWQRLLDSLEAGESQGSFLLRPFLRWFTPYFKAYSFLMARNDEYEADATAARLTSPAATAETLTAINVIGSYLHQRYWPDIHRLADDNPQPGFAPFGNITHGVAMQIDSDSATAWVNQAMARQTDSLDTHPALKDRLAALGQPPQLSLPAIDQTADRLLGSRMASLTEAFDKRWRDRIQQAWSERYREVQDGRQQLADFDTRITNGEILSIQERYNRARLTERYGNNADEALAQYHSLYNELPDDPVICFTLGSRLLERGDADGVAMLEHAMQLDEETIVGSCETLRDFHWRNGRGQEAQAWHERMLAQQKKEHEARQERDQWHIKDALTQHKLEPGQLDSLCAALRGIPGIARAYLAQKVVQHYPDNPLYILGFSARRWYQLDNRKRNQAVLERIRQEVPFPGETLIICVDGDNYRFGRKFRWMRGSRIL